jgi:hypothetical protein
MNIILTANKPQTEKIDIKCFQGCIIAKNPDPFGFARWLEINLNEEGLKYGQVLDDSNKFLCYDEINGAYIGNVSTDRNKMIPMLTKDHLDYFVTNYESSLPAGLEYSLCNPFRKLNETYTVEVEIVEENSNVNEEPTSEEPINEEPTNEEPPTVEEP